MMQFWPGPLTLILPRKGGMAAAAAGGQNSVGLRCPSHPVAREVLQACATHGVWGVAAPSANPFGYVSPTEAAHVESHLGHVVPMILDGGPCGVGVESTIVDVSSFPVKILRLGGITVEQIEDCLNEKVDIQISSSKPSAPGMLESHYAPRKPMFWYESIPENIGEGRIGYLSFSGNLSGEIVFELSSKGDLTEAAARLFQGMRWLDEQDIDRIEVKRLPELGLGRAMNDRLNRACRS
jgi:L-threonylcarbamoyladenylate synthase